MEERLIFDRHGGDGRADYFPCPGMPIKEAGEFIPENLLRRGLDLPETGESEVVRHYTNLSRKNFCPETDFYPLGSCTMKYNPKINENLACLEGFGYLHPYQDEEDLQGALELMYDLETKLCALTGMSRFSLQPSAGAHGEFAGMMICRAYHKSKGQSGRIKVIVPDSSHGTNPATAGMCGFTVEVIKSTEHGLVDIEALSRALGPDVAAVMLTCPNTLGLFEEEILKISELVHEQGALLYYDGANFNALMGITTPYMMGFDIIHLNLHKTFSTPHGGGGPGAGAVGVARDLTCFLPVPVINKQNGGFVINRDSEDSIGPVRSFYGNFSVLVKAYAYITRLGGEGMARAARNAVLNARYIQERLKRIYKIASEKPCMHEVVLSCCGKKERGITALDIAKRLIDYGMHPPTMYFPLIVREALMIEPAETESKETLDRFVGIMKTIDGESESSPELVKNAPHKTALGRVDEVLACRKPLLKWENPGG